MSDLISPATPVSVLEQLAEDPNKGVREGVADNPNTPHPCSSTDGQRPGPGGAGCGLLPGASTMSLQERLRCATSEDTATDMLADLAEDGDWRVRLGVASNPNTPIPVLHKLAAEDTIWSVTVAAEEALNQRRQDALGW